MDSHTAIFIGGLANKTGFFGGSTAETIARNVNYNAGWNAEYTRSAYSTMPWFMMGGRPTDGAGAGVFAFHDPYAATHIADYLSHRTILSGY